MDFKISELLKMQVELQEIHPEWGGTPPERGRDQLMWGIGEIGEVIDISMDEYSREVVATVNRCTRDLILNATFKFAREVNV
jgi:hypothetical protein